MKFLDKLFSKKPPIQKIDEMMPEGQFWDLVAQSLSAGRGDREEQLAYLEKAVAKLSPADMIGFRLRTDQLLYDTYTPQMWCAGYIMMGGCSDDAFEYFRLWVISCGKEAYYNARENPDSLVAFDGDGIDFDFEEFWYIANNAFEAKTGNEMDDYIDEDFTLHEGHYPEMIFNWSENDEESKRSICPRLYEKFVTA